MTAERYSSFANSMSTDQTPTADDILAACKKLKAADDVYQERMKTDARIIRCEWCNPAAVWKNNILWLCPHYLAEVKKLPKDSRGLTFSEHVAVQVGGLSIGAICSPEFAELMLGDISLRWGYL